MAESFIDTASSTLGKLELSWFTDSLPPTNGASTEVNTVKEPENVSPEEADVSMADASATNKHESEADLDIADDDDRWM